MILALKKFWREILIVILVIVVSIVSKSCQSKMQDIAVLKERNDSTYTVAKTYIDKSGKLVAQVKTHEATISELKKGYVDLGITNSELKKQVGSLNNLVGYWRVKAIARDTITVTAHDTVYIDKHGLKQIGGAFTWQTKFIEVDGIYHVDKTVSLAYQYNPSFSLTAYRKDKTFFKPGTLVVDVRFDDQNIKTKEITGVVVKEEPKKWYETGVAKFVAGVIAGIFISK